MPLRISGCQKRGVEFKGGSLHDGFGGFDGLAVLEAPCPPLLVLQNVGNGPNTVSGSTVSNTELSEFFWAH